MLEQQWVLKDCDIETFIAKGTGPGGQHRNKTESCVTLRHKPTGIEAKADMRSQHASKRMAREVLEARVAAHHQSAVQSAQQATRRAQVGSGMRGDKVRTYREQDDQVTDHRTNKRQRLSSVLKGDLGTLFSH